ncbi:MAG: hypothetical protein O9330_18805 [Beijerinckiaceae bacterium]|jgi:hypothetical protein|nr:hypothetical protein [Beijerinckiaceae bacterium]
MTTWIIGLVALPFATLAIAAVLFVPTYRRLKRAEFIRTYEWPPGLLDKLAGHHRGFTRKESALVAQGLRQFFLAYLNSGRAYVAMPSQVADDLWHAFILYTRAYQEFCQQAFGGFLHHTPAVALKEGRKKDNTGLRRVWLQCCKLDGINPVKPTRLPLLFALDTKLNIPGGYRYEPDCAQLRRNGDAGTQCGGDFSSSSYDGGTDGMGDSGRSDSGSSDGGGDGGSCGGGGGD